MINRAIIVGNITAQPELKSLPNGTAVSNFSVATNRVFKNKQGEKQEQVEFHRVVVFAKQAENCAHYLTKGQQVAVEGRLQTRKWEQGGATRYMTEIVADSVRFGRKPMGSSPDQQQEDGTAAPQAKPPNTTGGANDEEIDVKDIPF